MPQRASTSASDGGERASDTVVQRTGGGQGKRPYDDGPTRRKRRRICFGRRPYDTDQHGENDAEFASIGVRTTTTAWRGKTTRGLCGLIIFLQGT